jgi:hypothetical protein
VLWRRCQGDVRDDWIAGTVLIVSGRGLFLFQATPVSWSDRERRRDPKAVAKMCMATTMAATIRANAHAPFVEATAVKSTQTAATNSKSCRRPKRNSGVSATEEFLGTFALGAGRSLAGSKVVRPDAMARALLIGVQIPASCNRDTEHDQYLQRRE